MHKWSISHSEPLKIAFLLFDKFSNLCLANCLEPMRATNGFLQAPAFDWQFFTIDGAPVHSSSNLPVIAHGSIGDLLACDYLFILASYDYRTHDSAKTRQALQQTARRAATIVGLDTGPWLMAAADLLKGRRATVHWDVLQDFTERYVTSEVLRQRVVWDGNRVTCAGAMSAFDLTRDVIRTHLGEAMALDVDTLFLKDTPQAPTPRRYNPVKPTSVQRAIALMQENIETPLTLTKISHAIACPPKTLARRFQIAMGASPGQVYRHIRLSHARHLVETTALNIYEISLRCGYDSPASLTRAYKTRFGQSPTAMRP